MRKLGNEGIKRLYRDLDVSVCVCIDEKEWEKEKKKKKKKEQRFCKDESDCLKQWCLFPIEEETDH